MAREAGSTGPDGSGGDARRRGGVPLRIALVTLLVGLLLLTVASIVVVGAITSQRSVDELEDRWFEATSAGVGGEVRPFLEPAVAALADVRSQALAGRVDLGDSEDLGHYLAARLEHLPTVAWLTFSDDATGRFTGCWRREDGSIVLNRSDPAVRGGTPREHVVREDGSLEPFERTLPGGYDPRTRPWYRAAVASLGTVWTEPFQFNEGRRGITAALALRDGVGAAPRGVLTADFFVDELSRFFDGLAQEPTTALRLLTKEGNVVADSEGARRPDSPLTPAVVAELVGGAQGSPPWRFEHRDEAHVAGAREVRVAGGGRWTVLMAVPEEQFLAGVSGYRRTALVAAAAFLALSVVLGWWLANRVASPLRRIAEDLERVAHFELSDVPSPRSRVKEIGVVADAADRMKSGLRSFGRYVPREVVRELLASGSEARLGGVHRPLTVLFADAAGFTRVAETMEPSRLAEHLGEFLEAVDAEVRAHRGTVDKFLGDGVLALFNAPQDVEDHAAAACRAALAAQERLARLAERWTREGKPVLRARMGLHTGDVVVGNFGTPERFAYTALGDPVNLASRLEALNKRYGTGILASDATRRAAGPGFEWRPVDRVAVVGRAEATLVQELLGETGRVDAATLLARDEYAAALDALRGRDFARAADVFRALAAARPDDGPSRLLAERSEAYLRAPPPPEWDGTEALQSK